MTVSGHLWTLLPTARHMVLPNPAPPSRAWATSLLDPQTGVIQLSGRISDAQRSDVCLVIVHGIAGSADSFYCRHAARAAQALGVPHLRLSMRGTECSGADIYHSGLVDDLEAACASPALAHFKHLLVLGYSQAGHIALRLGLAPLDPRMRAIAAICPPLDLSLTAEAMDRPEAHLYQQAVLSGLKENYAAVAARRAMPFPLKQVQAARNLREWDALTVIPRFGFSSVEDYYSSMSVGEHLSELALPSLIVTTDRDPMIPLWTYQDALMHRALPRVTWHRHFTGGHVAFPAKEQVEQRAIRWLLDRLP